MRSSARSARLATSFALFRSLSTVLGARGVMVPPPTTTSVDPRSICDRYSDDTYSKMEGDRERTAAYAAAITAAAPGRVCLDIGTGALALLALIAARAGAKHVYAIEANPEAAAAARSLVAAEGFAEVVTIIDGYSTDVTLPERADLLLHEILGEVHALVPSVPSAFQSVTHTVARVSHHRRSPAPKGWCTR